MQKVELHISGLLSLLENGLTWLQSEDQGFGSIQENYGATEQEIAIIRKHPKLANVEPNVFRFVLIDDTQEIVEEPVRRQRKPKQYEEATNVTEKDLFNVAEQSEEELNAFINI
jgi:hypothetical protein